MTTTTTRTMTLRNDNGRDVRIKAAKIGAVSSHDCQGPRQNRWTELDLWRTTGGKLVLQITGISQWQGEGNRHRVIVCADEAAVIAALEEDNGGTLGELAKELLDAAGIEHTETVE